MSDNAVATPSRNAWYSEERIARYAPLTGVLAVVLWIVSVFVLEGAADSPGDDASTEEIAAYFNDENGPILVGGFLFMLGSAVFLWFLATLRARLHLAEGGPGRLASIVFASGTVIAAMTMAATAPQVGGALVAEDGGRVDPGSAQAFWNLGDGFFVAASAAVFVFYVASALGILRTRVLPVWLGWASLVLAVIALIPPIGWATLVWGLPLWLLIASVWMFMRGGEKPLASAPDAPATRA